MPISPKRIKYVPDGRPSFQAPNPSLTFIAITINRRLIRVMVNTGATHSLIALSTLGILLHPPIQPTSTTAAILGDTRTTITIHRFVCLCIYINCTPIYTFVFVADSSGVDFILGMDWFLDNDVLLPLREQKLLVHLVSCYTNTVRFLHSPFILIRFTQSI